MSETMALEATGLEKTLGRTKALDGVDLEVPRGSILGMLGPNGAGKTTTVRVLATLLRPDRGSARVAGHDVVTEAALVRRHIGLTGQYAALDESLTGRANLVMIGRLGRLPAKAAKARADELLSQFSLTDAADRGVKTYSGGMRRRLDLAASLVTRPQILFLDEPTTGLDLSSQDGDLGRGPRPRQRRHDGAAHHAVSGRGRPIADRIAVIDQGQVIADGTPAQLKAKVGGERVKLTVAAQSDLGTAAEVLARHATEPPRPDPATREIEAPVTAAARRMPEIVRDLDAAGVLLDDLAIRHPSLDDVFLTLTGRKSEETPKEGDQS